MNNVTSWMFGDGKHDDSNDDNSNSSQDVNTPPPTPMPALDAEEIRRRRLNNAQLTTFTKPSASESPPATEIIHSSPKRANVQLQPNNTTPQEKKKTRPPSSPALSDQTNTPSPTPSSQGAKADRYSRTLNLALEFIFQITVRKESARPNIIFMDTEGDSDFLNVDNLEYLLPMRLVEVVQEGVSGPQQGAPCYLIRAYKRLLEKENQTLKEDPMLKDLQSCKIQIVRFLASALTDKDFGGIQGQGEFVRTLGVEVGQGGASGSFLSVLLKELAEELSSLDMFTEVATSCIMMCYEGLHNPSAAAHAAPVMGMPPPMQRSIFDNISEPLTALLLLVKADKRYAKAATSCACFLPNPQMAHSTTPTRGNMFAPPVLETNGVGGCHIEHNTLLGRILRIGASSQDPKVFELFKDSWKSPANVVEANIVKLRQIMNNVQGQASDMILCLLKAGPQAKENTMKWIYQALYCNVEAEKDRPSPLIASSQAFLFNFAGTLLRIAKPIISDPKKLAKVDWNFIRWMPSKETLGSNESKFLFPSASTRLMTSGSDHQGEEAVSESFALEPDTTTEFTFISQSFFCALRVLHLGAVQECIRYPHILRALHRLSAGFEVGDMNSLHHLSLKCTMDASLVMSDLMNDVALFIPACASSLLSQLQADASATMPGLQRLPSGQVKEMSWTVPQSSAAEEHVKLLCRVPEHVVDDLMELLLFISKSNPKSLSIVSLTPVLELILYLMRRPWGVTSPHLRAKLGQVVYFVFTPPASRGSDQNRFQIEHYRTTSVNNGQSSGAMTEGPHHQLLESYPEAQAFLAPALLLLYGDVESTGFYEILSHRRCIMVVLKHLWTLSSHRAAFRAISMDKIYFISFANGLLNETNSLVGSVMDTLAEIRVTQLEMQNTVQWAALSEEARKEKMEKHEQNENEVRAKSDLCIETIHMLNYLTSEEDESLRLPFLVDEILPRFSSMLLNVVRLLVGPKGLAIKVDNMESYNFNPKNLLKEICVIMTHFDSYEVFVASLAADGFIADSEGKILLSKALSTVQKLHLLTPMEVSKMSDLVNKVIAARENYKDIDSLTDDAPENYLDPLMATIMRDPVLLPTSGNIVDRATITTQLLQTSIDPFNRKPLTIAQVVPQDDLREEISAWLLSHGIDFTLN